MFGSPFSNSSGEIAYDHDTESLEFQTKNIIGMAIDDDQNVGIGTTTPGLGALGGAAYVADKVLTISGGSANLGTVDAEQGVLEIARGVQVDDGILGSLAFVNLDNKFGEKPVAIIRGLLDSVASNAAEDSGGYLQFRTKPAGGALATAMTISPTGTVTVPDLGVANGRFACASATGGLSAEITCSTSTRATKKNIANLDLGLDTVLALRPVTFDWKANGGQPTTLGFIAEEVEAVSPLLAAYTDAGELRSVQYAQMSALTVKAIQELAARLGVATDATTITIGQQGTQTGAFIAGIRGVTTGNADAVAVVIDSNGQLGTVSSLLRYKEDVRDMGDVTAALMRLRPVTFRYTHTFNGGAQPLQYGLIAEEVAEILPGLVVFNEDGLPETVQYRKVNAMLLNEVQQLHRQNEVQQTVIEEMRASERLVQRQIEDMRASEEALRRQFDDVMRRLAAIEAATESTRKQDEK